MARQFALTAYQNIFVHNNKYISSKSLIYPQFATVIKLLLLSYVNYLKFLAKSPALIVLVIQVVLIT